MRNAVLEGWERRRKERQRQYQYHISITTPALVSFYQLDTKQSHYEEGISYPVILWACLWGHFLD